MPRKSGVILTSRKFIPVFAVLRYHNRRRFRGAACCCSVGVCKAVAEYDKVYTVRVIGTVLYRIIIFVNNVAAEGTERYYF